MKQFIEKHQEMKGYAYYLVKSPDGTPYVTVMRYIEPVKIDICAPSIIACGVISKTSQVNGLSHSLAYIYTEALVYNKPTFTGVKS